VVIETSVWKIWPSCTYMFESEWQSSLLERKTVNQNSIALEIQMFQVSSLIIASTHRTRRSGRLHPQTYRGLSERKPDQRHTSCRKTDECGYVHYLRAMSDFPNRAVMSRVSGWMGDLATNITGQASEILYRAACSSCVDHGEYRYFDVMSVSFSSLCFCTLVVMSVTLADC